MTYLLKYYVNAFTYTKSDRTLPIRYNNFYRWDAVQIEKAPYPDGAMDSHGRRHISSCTDLSDMSYDALTLSFQIVLD